MYSFSQKLSSQLKSHCPCFSEAKIQQHLKMNLSWQAMEKELKVKRKKCGENGIRTRGPL